MESGPASTAVADPHPPGVDPDDLVPDRELNFSGGGRPASVAAAPAGAGPLTNAQLGDRLEQLITALPAALAAFASQSAMSPTMLKEIIQGAVEGTTQKRIIENTVHPHISAFSYPEGDIAAPKPKLSRKTYFVGIEEKEDRLTPGEIEAFNAITETRDARGGAWRAMITRSRFRGDAGELHVIVPAATVDQRMMLPGSLTLILLELNGGPASTDVSFLLQQIETLKGMLLKKGFTAAELESQMMASGYPASV